MKRRELFVKNAIESALKDGRTNHKGSCHCFCF